MIRLFLSVVIVIVSVYNIEGTATEGLITGKITYAGSSIIDKDAQVEVSLQDVTLMDVESKVIASTTVSNAQTFPISYQLQYNQSDIESGRIYVLSARITGPENKLFFINDVQIRAPLADTASPTIDIAVTRVEETSSIDTTQINNQQVCEPVKCSPTPELCQYGYEKENGCEICTCHYPCNPLGKPVLCGSEKLCFVVKQMDGTVETRCDAESSKRSKADCDLPKAASTCEAYFPRFFYNPTTKDCESFIYGGCHGNANNFKSKFECEKSCKI